jgi:hypothetical protein
MNERGVLQDGQAGFRKGRGTMDNVHRAIHERGTSEPPPCRNQQYNGSDY